ncbi:MAG: bifunctional phosphoribosylaminoimidazolecarboxamide formyltransferase/IMP cyclohydrolase PurH, partial [Thermoplasmata archaeon]
PFEDIIKQDNPVMEEVIENIDIGGPTLVRAAAKNFEHVTVIVNPDRYKDVIEELRSKGEVSLEKKRELAVEAFEHIARYDAIIANYLRERLTKNKFPKNLVIPLEKVQPTRYGENPHQEASFYRILPYGGGITNAEQLQGKQLSYNNILDAEAALDCLREFSEPTAVIVKHTSPCGIASAKNIMDAWKKAFETDPISPFGGIVAFNREVEEKLAEELTKHFLEIVIAPHFGKEALNVFKKKKNLRLLQVRDIYSGRGNFVYRSVNGGMLVQDKDTGEIDTSNWKVVTRKKPNKEDIESMIFAVKCVKHVKSNAVVFVKESKTVAIGGGQTSRIDAVRVAVDKGGERIRDSIMASDGFFPFRDAIDVAADAGVRAIVQPGGSIRDKEIIEAADERGICMVFTGQRYFRH